VCKAAEHFATWVYILLKATHAEQPHLFKGERIVLKPGQFTTARSMIADDLHISESKVQRILKTFEIEQQIEQQMSSEKRLITVVKWDEYQKSEQQIEPIVNSNRTASEQQVNIQQECKNIKNDKNERSKPFVPPALDEVRAYCESRKNGIDPEQFVAHYQARGWFLSNGKKVQDWKACVITWEKRRKERQQDKQAESKEQRAWERLPWPPGIDKVNPYYAKNYMNLPMRKKLKDFYAAHGIDIERAQKEDYV
jgi:Spy/CpxP family protein refolding chaperone